MAEDGETTKIDPPRKLLLSRHFRRVTRWHRVTRFDHRDNHRVTWTGAPTSRNNAAFSAEKRGESREETAGEWRKAERILFGSPLSFLPSPALLPRSGNGHADHPARRQRWALKVLLVIRSSSKSIASTAVVICR